MLVLHHQNIFIMKLHVKVFSLALILVPVIFSSCKKEVDADVSEKYLGRYAYTFSYAGDIIGTDSYQDTATIGKIAVDKIAFITNQSAHYYTATSNNSISEDDGQTISLPIDTNGNMAEFTENSTGILVDGTLTINGTWKKNGYTQRTFKIIARKI